MLTAFATSTALPDCDVCVVGAGPVGIALALACEDRGMSVLLLESGPIEPDKLSASLTAGHEVNVERHATADVAMCRGLGGASRWWGGRCIPYDDIDFADRKYLSGASWPIPHAEVSRWYKDAADFFGIGRACFAAAIEPWTDLGDIRFDMLERWTPEINAGVRHRMQLERSSRITVLLGATVTKIMLTENGDRVGALMVANVKKEMRLEPKQIVLACGGLESTRLLLEAQQRYPGICGGGDGALGRGYMGHISGKIADLCLSEPTSAAAHDFFLDDGIFVRRRFTIEPQAQLRERLLNIALWIDNPPFHNHKHRNGVLSLVWLALAIPPIGRLLVSEGIRISHVGKRPHHGMRHIWNVMRSPVRTTIDILKILHARFLSSPRKPDSCSAMTAADMRSIIMRNMRPVLCRALCCRKKRTYSDCRILTLSCNSPISMQNPFCARTSYSTSRFAAPIWGDSNITESSPESRLESILTQATDGVHQAGTTRMSAAAAEGVVDADCRVHGVGNLFVASSSVFSSSSSSQLHIRRRRNCFSACRVSWQKEGHKWEFGGSRFGGEDRGMRQVHVAKLGRNVSAVGFGCASLGSRVSAVAGRRAIDRAYDLGVTWFDVAPPYGDGQAEGLLGQFLQARRDKVVICTKFGISRPDISLAKKLVRPAARYLVQAFPSLRKSVSGSRSTGWRVIGNPAAIENSVTTSLRLLRTDYIDVLALHEPTAEDAASSATFEVLNRLKEKGLIRAIAVAGAPESIMVAIAAGYPIDVVQFPNSPVAGIAPKLRETLVDKAPFFVTHGVFNTEATKALASLPASQLGELSELAKSHEVEIGHIGNDLRLHYAISNNQDGVVIISMYDSRHIEQNISAFATPLPSAFADAIRKNVSANW